MPITRNYLPLDKLKKKQLIAHQRPLCATAAPTTSIFGGLPLWGTVKDQVQEVYDQGVEGSCTANAFCAAFRIMQSDKSFNPSRQYVYYKERLLENEPNNISDSGADVMDAVSWVSKNGVCSEASWPYNTQTVNTPPPVSCDAEAKLHKMGSFTTISVGDNDSIKKSLLTGVPVMIAIGVYKSFESEFTNLTGVVWNPKPKNYEDPNDPDDPFLGGHEILIVGYYDIPGFFTVLNSWGKSWGHGGFCYLPFSYVSNPKLTYELCTVQKFQD